MWNRKGYSKEERLKDLKSLGKFIIKNPEDYFRLLVYIEFPIYKWIKLLSHTTSFNKNKNTDKLQRKRHVACVNI